MSNCSQLISLKTAAHAHNLISVACCFQLGSFQVIFVSSLDVYVIGVALNFENAHFIALPFVGLVEDIFYISHAFFIDDVATFHLSAHPCNFLTTQVKYWQNTWYIFDATGLYVSIKSHEQTFFVFATEKGTVFMAATWRQAFVQCSKSSYLFFRWTNSKPCYKISGNISKRMLSATNDTTSPQSIIVAPGKRDRSNELEQTKRARLLYQSRYIN